MFCSHAAIYGKKILKLEKSLNLENELKLPVQKVASLKCRFVKLVSIVFTFYYRQLELLTDINILLKRKYRSSCLELFLRKGVLKIFRKLTGERPCRCVISIKLLWNFIEITIRHGCSPVNLL